MRLLAEPALLPGSEKRLIVFFGLVGVGMGKRAEGIVHRRVASQIGGNSEAVAGPCVCPGKRPAAEGSKMCQAVGIDLREVRRPLPSQSWRT